MVLSKTWRSYLRHKASYSATISLQKYNAGRISELQVWDSTFRNLFQGKITYLCKSEGEQMAPTITGEGQTLLVRKLPFLDSERAPVFVGDVVALTDPYDSSKHLVRRLAALGGQEMVSKNEKDEPFLLNDEECWVLSDNKNLEVKKAKDSRLFGPVSVKNVIGRVIYCLRTPEDHGSIINSNDAMEADSPILALELDLEEMAMKSLK